GHSRSGTSARRMGGDRRHARCRQGDGAGVAGTAGAGAVTQGQAALGTAAFFVAAPGVVAGVIPWLVTGWRLPEPLPLGGLAAVPGVALIGAGFWVLVDSFVRFARNHGTPAPIAPTRKLVVDGW